MRRSDSSLKGFAQLAQSGEGRAHGVRRGHRGRDRHQADDPQVRPGATGVEQGRYVFRTSAPLLGLVAHVDLDQRLECASLGLGAAIEGIAEGRAVERLHHVEVPGHGTRLVALELADEVEAGGRCGTKRGPHLGQLGDGFLHVVLAHVAQAGAHGSHDRGRRLALRDADERHLVSRAADAGARRRDPRFDRNPPLGDREAHSVTPSAASAASVSSRGRPITFVSLPTTFATKRRPSPWIA
jgi:hypothetical protein